VSRADGGATVVVVGTLDTKGREVAFVAERVRAAGATPLVVDVGVLEPPTGEEHVASDVAADEVARAGGRELEELRTGGETAGARAAALDVMAAGLTAVLRRLLAEGRCDAVLGLGGSSGTNVATSAMRALPVGVPKVMVSTMASGDVSPYVGTKDICLMYSVTDIAGLNRISRLVLENAAHAAAGMARHRGGSTATEQPPLVAITMFGVTTPCVLRVQQALEARGFETAVFHATGAGGRCMEELVEDGLVQGVVDLTTSELTDELCGGILSAGPDRLEAAGRKGIPQVVVPGALEIINWGPKDTVPEAHRVPERRLHVHNPTVTITRTNLEESRELGRILAEKVSRATGPAIVLLPLEGLSAVDAPGQPYEDREADAALFEAIRSGLREDIPLREVEAAINDPEFADAVVSAFDEVWAAR
jgi:uncharacterized protein (UPF0261 family)